MPDDSPHTQSSSSLHAISPGEWLWLSAAILTSLALRIPFFTIAMVADEGGYAYATRGWVEGTGQLYGDLWISRPQGIFLVYAGIFDLFGTGTVALRFAAWIAVAVTTVIVWGLARAWRGPGVALLAAFAFAIVSSLPNLEGYTANAEVFMGAPIALAAVWLLHASRCGWHQWSLAGVGVLIGIGTSLKPSAIVMFVVAVVFISTADRVCWREAVRRIGIVAGGGAIVAIASALHGWTLGWSDFVYATFTYRLTAQSAATVGLDHNLDAILRLVLRAWALLALIGFYLALNHYERLPRGVPRLSIRPLPGRWLERVSAPVKRLVRRTGSSRAFGSHSGRSATPNPAVEPPRAVWRRLPGRPADDGTRLLHLWMLGAFAGMSIGGDWWPHYVLQTAAPLAIWLAGSARTILDSLNAPGRRVFSAVSLGLLLAPFWVLGYGNSQDMQRAMFAHPGYPAQDEVAAYIRERTVPGTTIFVAFDQASIYYLADRPPAYRHLYDQELRGIPSSYTDVTSIISGPERPMYIIGTRQPGPFPDESRAFWTEVGQYYVLETTIEGVPIYRDKATIGN